MRVVPALVLATLLIGWSAGPTQAADPYRWCATYGGSGDDGGGTNCYFVTLEQCQAAISGNGGFCSHNPFYTGAPSGEPRRAKRKRAGRG